MASIMTGFGRTRGALFALVVAFSLAGCDHITEPEGPRLVDRFGDFALLDTLTVTEDVVDFSGGESVGFAARFNKQVNWVVEIVGLESGAVKRIEGFSSELTNESVRWEGRTSQLPFFKEEPVEARLFVPAEEADTSRVQIEVIGTREYPGDVAADFEEAAGSDIFLGNFEFEFDLEDTGRSTEVPPAQGDYFYLLRSTGGPAVADPFFIGLIRINASITGQTYFSVPTTVPDNLFFNAFLYSFGTPNTIAVVQLAVDTNGTGAYEDGQDATFPVIDQPVDWEGWQAFSVPLSATAITPAQTEEIVAIRVLLISNDTNQPDPPLPVEYGIDYITFTAGGPLEL